LAVVGGALRFAPLKQRTMSVSTADGRAIHVVVAGAEHGTPVVIHHGTPGSAYPYPPFVEAAAQRGLRHVEYSRPGYAGSDRHPGRRVADCALDVAAILDALGAERCYTHGASGGAPHALACAALLGERVIKVASIAGGAPWRADGLDWLEGMGESNKAEFNAALEGDAALARYLEHEAAELAGVTGEQLAAALGDLVSDPDRAALTGGFAAHAAARIRIAVGAGIWGWFDDDLAFTKPWGFPLNKIVAPVTVWHGTEDRFVPFSHGAWLAQKLPGAHRALRTGEGHLSLAVGSYAEILDDLVAI
jgi:pimeloyl-ACP methyl ester carboxylesterase